MTLLRHSLNQFCDGSKMIFGLFLPFILVIGQYTIAPEIPMSGPVSKHPPPRINPSTEMSGLSLPSSSSNKPKFDEKLSREAGVLKLHISPFLCSTLTICGCKFPHEIEHRISIPSSAFKHEPSRDTGLARPEFNSRIPQSTFTPTHRSGSMQTVPPRRMQAEPPRQGICLGVFCQLPCEAKVAIVVVWVLSLEIVNIYRTCNINGTKHLRPKKIHV
ncbi:hypothetical protein MJO29_009374 [Puccinia striiformis f. sp. tritici]|nr:hypothetical protein MJO29_009374 [Puccinia striiformis f. sp. tritici]